MAISPNIVVAAVNTRSSEARDFTCNGATDQYTIITAAQLALSAGSKVTLLAGNYKITGGIVLPPGIEIEGQGAATVILAAAGNNQVYNMVATTGSGSKIRRLTLDGNQPNQTGTSTIVGISLPTGTDGVWVEDCFIRNMTGKGIVASCNRFRMFRSAITNCQDAGLSLASSTGSIIQGNQFRNNGLSGALTQAHITVATITDCAITGNVMLMDTPVTTTNIGINGTALVRCSITGNVWEGNSTTGGGFLVSASGMSDCTISGNVAKAGLAGIKLTGATKCAISGNSITGTGGTGTGVTGGILLTTCSICDVATNTIASSGDDGIELNSCNTCSVVNNNITTAGNNGITIQGASNARCTFVGNICQSCTNQGLDIADLVGGTIKGNVCYLNGAAGILIEGGSDLEVEGNFCTTNSRTDGTWANIQTGTGSVTGAPANLLVTANVCRAGASGNRPTYGINLSGSASKTLVVNNDLRSGGMNGNFVDSNGVSTRTNFGSFTKRKAANQTVTNSTVLVNDSELVVPIDANESQLVEFAILADAPATNDVKFAITVPAAASIQWNALVTPAGGAAPTDQQGHSGTDTGTMLGIGAGTTRLFTVKAMVINGANAGSVTFQFAENTGGVGTSAVVRAGSAVSARRLTA